MRFGLLQLLTVLCVACMPMSLDAQTLETPVRLLKSHPLSVEVMVPGHGQRYNRGVRFTELAAVLSARVSGQEFLYSPDEHNAIDDHGGLASEFDLVTPLDPDELMPTGYREAKAGEGFLKIGVGVLKKQTQRYSLFQHPELMIPAVTTVQWKEDSAEFLQVCSGIGGYAYELKVNLAVRQNKLVMDWQLKNTGTRKLVTRHYNHNFFRFGETEIGPGYALRFPFDFSASGLLPEQRQVGREIQFTAPIPTWTNLLIPFPDRYDGPNQCELVYEPTGARVICQTSVKGIFTAVHARRNFVSPEQFVLLDVEPNQTAHWQRRYELIASGTSSK